MFNRGSFVRFVSLIVVLSAAACATPERHVYEPVAHHTVKVGPDIESDVVWIQKFTHGEGSSKLYRCHAVQGIPRCDAVTEAATATASAK